MIMADEENGNKLGAATDDFIVVMGFVMYVAGVALTGVPFIPEWALGAILTYAIGFKRKQ